MFGEVSEEAAESVAHVECTGDCGFGESVGGVYAVVSGVYEVWE